MAREITPDEIRAADLGRSIRGYDRRQTEQLLADIAEAHTEVIAQRDALMDQLETLRLERRERESQWKHDEASLSARIEASKRRMADLEAERERLREANAMEGEEFKRLRDDLAKAHARIGELASELAEQEEFVNRLRTRDKALSEQLAMLDSEARAHSEAVTGEATAAEEQALVALARVEQAAETVERQAREQVEEVVAEVRERVDQILRPDYDVSRTESQPDDDSPIQREGPHNEVPRQPLDELDTPATTVGHEGEPSHRPEFEPRPILEFPLDLRRAPQKSDEDQRRGDAEEGADLPLGDYREPSS
jgi:DNA repair exonuclease SbcCD ATPase subunit